MAATETFDPKRYTPFEPGLESNRVLSTFRIDRHGRRHDQDFEGARTNRRRDGPRHADPLLHGRRPGLHPALAAPISLAHRLCAAADRGRAAHRLDDRAHARPAESGRAGIYRHRPAIRRRRGRGAEGVPPGRLPRQRIRPVLDSAGRRGHGQRATATGHDSRPLREPLPVLQETGRKEPHWPIRQRLPEGILGAIAGQRPSIAQFAGRPRPST